MAEAVQEAVHRIQSTQQVFDLVHAARARGLESINIDLIYGLPRQSLASMERTLEQVVTLRPDRIALYAYAHLPQRFKPQRRIDVDELPDGSTKVAMLAHALEVLVGAGYVYVGMDHFALPDDALAVAKRQGRLHRNFQGYSTRPDCDLIALGVSAISRIGDTYAQNHRILLDYYKALDDQQLPLAKGLVMTRDDEIRRAAIHALLCQSTLDMPSFERTWGIDFATYFEPDLAQLQKLERDGLIEVTKDSIDITPRGRFLARIVAMRFDRHLRKTNALTKFSRVI